jgi:hypothetical protein
VSSTTQKSVVFERGDADSTHLLTHENVDIYLARTADICGLQGCVTAFLLFRVEIENYGTRVVCPAHAEELVRREVVSE